MISDSMRWKIQTAVSSLNEVEMQQGSRGIGASQGDFHLFAMHGHLHSTDEVMQKHMILHPQHVLMFVPRRLRTC